MTPLILKTQTADGTFSSTWYSGSNGTPAIARWVQAHQLLVDWDEMQATMRYRLNGIEWDTDYVGLNDIDAKSTFESTLLFQASEPPSQWKSWNLTALTQKWREETAQNYGVVLWATNENTDSQSLQFNSSEATSNQPYLEITYSTKAKTVYFLKDHLGSVRATVQDTAGAPVVGYDDYDPWGYTLADRTMASSVLPLTTRNKFTGKERDVEYGVNWDYFGARYYDAQIGRWMVRDPLANKYPRWSPYVYTLDNPIVLIDSNGKKPLKARIAENPNRVLDYINSKPGNAGDILSGSVPLPGNTGRLFRGDDKLFVATKSGFIVDMEHFIAAAATTYALSGNVGGKVVSAGAITKDEYMKLHKERFGQLPQDEKELEEMQKKKEEEMQKRQLKREQEGGTK